ncbi:hypothetical protein BDU57DRAFT_519634 [Ampelomyces quisqualis]|uniref:Uncharacterized protein n=1 Tax=Ampelomyces quisqualis TaxID=50730 RepID=A0A6A5QG82_AMPQU|nr:hypothetical protein BDU57DRAFT_519634 [Ampelomyces quisqualis]
MAKLTGNTVGSLKKMWPPVKKKAVETHPSFATFLGLSTAAASTNTAAVPAEPPTAAAPKPKVARKRKADSDADNGTPTPAKPKGRAPKTVKTNDVVHDPVNDDPDSADGGDGLEATRATEVEVEV